MKNMKKFIKENLIGKSDQLISGKLNEKWFLKNNFQKEYQKILKLTNFIPENSKFSIRCKHILNNLYEIPKCLECGKELKPNCKNWYRKFCSNKCASKNPLRQEKCKKTCQKKYGKKFYFQTDIFKQQYIEKNGIDNVFKLKEIQEKIKQINLKNLGVENIFQSEKIKEKCKQKMLENHGVDNPSKSKKIQKRIRISRGDLNFEIWLENGGKRTKGNGICLHSDCNEETEWYNNYHNKGRHFTIFCKKHQRIVSSLEYKIQNLIKEMFPEIEFETNSRKIIRPKELDIYFPTLNKAIEVNGDYTHSSYEMKKRDKIKLEKCKKKNIQLLTIWENDINNNWDKVKNEIKKFLTSI